MSRACRFFVLTALFFSAGCAALEPLLTALTPEAASTETVTPEPPATATATATRPAPEEPPLLRLWLPPQFDPTTENEAATLLGARLTEFEAQHPGLKVEIRLKASGGEADLVNVLSLTGTAAPAALPDLILLSRPDLESAALKGLLHPVDGLSTSLEDPNWYAYAQQLAHIQNTGYGLPFAGDALVLIHYPDLDTLVTWDDVLASDGQLVFPAGNQQALVGLSLYASVGGKILDAQGAPILELDPLIRVLTLIEAGRSKRVFPASLANVTTESQALQIYRTGSANKGIISILSFRPPEDGAFGPLPGLAEVPFSYASGWVWALAGSDPEKQQLAVELAEFLVEDPFIGEWTRATGFLPSRPSSVEQNDRALAAILESAHPVPASNVLSVLGPLVQEALTRVLNGESPGDVAGSVVEKLK